MDNQDNHDGTEPTRTGERLSLLPQHSDETPTDDSPPPKSPERLSQPVEVPLPVSLSRVAAQQLEDKLPLQGVRVHFPLVKDSLLNSFLLYRIEVKWNGNNFDLHRRFSDCEALRTAIRNYLPYSFIFPIHKKQIMVSLEGKYEKRIRAR